MIKEIEKKASNYVRGRAMALSFKPLSLEDIKEAYLYGAEDYAHMSTPINSWHKASEELPNHFGDYLVVIESQQFAGRRYAIKCWYGYPIDPFGDNPTKEWALEDDEIVTHWMEIPTLRRTKMSAFISIIQDWGHYTKVIIMHCSGAGSVELFVYNDTDTAEIASLYVVPQMRGRGLAKMLIQQAERKAKTLGAKRTKILSEPHLTAFYKELGYKEDQIRVFGHARVEVI